MRMNVQHTIGVNFIVVEKESYVTWSQIQVSNADIHPIARLRYFQETLQNFSQISSIPVTYPHLSGQYQVLKATQVQA